MILVVLLKRTQSPARWATVIALVVAATQGCGQDDQDDKASAAATGKVKVGKPKPWKKCK
jgi:hypothetical protein